MNFMPLPIKKMIISSIEPPVKLKYKNEEERKKKP